MPATGRPIIRVDHTAAVGMGQFTIAIVNGMTVVAMTGRERVATAN